ncbi:ABC transporter permease [Labrys wisconsinensis]|uniref:NitT/TauT family transport system permease protein n=1 Tax=Labrys wisconsinensis TaxID=425677 RepID=A0ABU0J5H7_9HYPH|nr:ABC transporter permease [Labrys wisconsinensis]MDQ0468885.1 NitT/TauT family transport system permease protein [Labrys wisconsinensis]
MSQAEITNAPSIGQAVSKPKGAARGKKEARGINGTAVSLVGLVILFAGWSLAVRYLDVPSYILPSPAAVWNALWSGIAVNPASPLGYYLPLWGTLKNAAIGLVIGSGLGLTLGSLMAESRLIEKLVMPYAFALQSLPKVAIAPLVVIWFGFGDGSKIAISALLAFFPMLINSFTGLRAVEPERIDLMRSLSASRFETYRIVKLPNAAPYIFAGLDMAVVYALLGTIVAEFLGAQQGMGVVITQAQAVTDVAGVFAALVILGAMGILLHGIVRGVERRVVHWGDRGRK